MYFITHTSRVGILYFCWASRFRFLFLSCSSVSIGVLCMFLEASKKQENAQKENQVSNES
jgi:hypothetical protein